MAVADGRPERTVSAKARVTQTLAGGAGLLTAGALGVALHGTRGDVAFDRLSARVVGPPSPVPGRVAIALAHLGDREPIAVVLGLVAVVAVFRYRRLLPVLAVIGTGALTQALVLLGKRWVDRTLFSSGATYPSGHVAGATAVFLLAVLVTRHGSRRTLWLVSAVVAMLPLGAALGAIWTQSHVMTDVLGGSLVGAGAGLVAWSALGPSGPPRRSAGLLAGRGQADPGGDPSVLEAVRVEGGRGGR